MNYVIQTQAESVEPGELDAHKGKLVHTYTEIKEGGRKIVDPVFQVAVENAVFLRRKVEVYLEGEWKTAPSRVEGFREPPQTYWPLLGWESRAVHRVALDAFGTWPPDQELPLVQVPENLSPEYSNAKIVDNGALYIGNDEQQPGASAMKISFTWAPANPTTISFIAKIDQNGAPVPLLLGNGSEVFWYQTGRVTIEEYLARPITGVKDLKFLLTIFFFCCLGFTLCHPLIASRPIPKRIGITRWGIGCALLLTTSVASAGLFFGWF